MPSVVEKFLVLLVGANGSAYVPKYVKERINVREGVSIIKNIDQGIIVFGKSLNQ